MDMKTWELLIEVVREEVRYRDATLLKTKDKVFVLQSTDQQGAVEPHQQTKVLQSGIINFFSATTENHFLGYQYERIWIIVDSGAII